MRTIIHTTILLFGFLVGFAQQAKAVEPIYWPVHTADDATMDRQLISDLFVSQQVAAPIVVLRALVQQEWNRDSGVPALWERGVLNIKTVLTLQTRSGEQTFVARSRQVCQKILGTSGCATKEMRNRNEINLLSQVQRWLAQHPLGTADYAPETTLFWRAG